jgi:Mce-associated membrane protein
MAVAELVNTEHEVDEPRPTPERTPSAGFRRGLLVSLLAGLLVASGSLVWLAAHRTGSASDTQAEREQVMSLSEQFMLRMGTYGPDLLDDQGQMPDYRSGVKELITAKFATSFDTQVGAAEQLVKQTGVSRKADVYATGVSSIDGDSADVLVAGAFTDSYKGKPGEPLAVRMQVSLVKVDGTWLVDNFAPLTAPETGAAK